MTLPAKPAHICTRIFACIILGVFLLVTAADLSAQQVDTFFVSPAGQDGWTGRLTAPNQLRTDGPFASLERARDIVRKQLASGVRAAVVRVRGGLYLRQHSFVLEAANGGVPGHPIVWEAFQSEVPRLAGAARIVGWRHVQDTTAIAQFPAGARDSIVVAPVPESVTIGPWQTDGHSIRPVPPELVWNGNVLNVARWPDSGWDRIVSVDSSQGVRIQLATDTIARWVGATDAWVVGYWHYDWSESFIRVTAVDLRAKSLLLARNPRDYGIVARARYAIVNLPEELSAPGEYWIDVRNRLIYVWPPSDPTRAEVLLTAIIEPVVDIRGASDLLLRGLHIEAARGIGVRVEGGARVQIVGGTLKSLGGRAIDVHGGVADVIRDVTIQDVGEGGIWLSGGDRRTLVPSGNLVGRAQISRFARWVYTHAPGVYVTGVGVTVRGCDIGDAPNSGIMIEGNDHLIESNVFHDLLLDTRDAGAVYMGRDWTARGNVIRGNYFYDLGPRGPTSGSLFLSAVYLDDMASGATVAGNVFANAQMAVVIGGGRDNRLEANVIIRSIPPVHIDARGRDWRASAEKVGSVWQYLVGLFRAARPDSVPYYTRYPKLSDALTDRPGEPIGNSFVNNVIVGNEAILRVGVDSTMFDERGTVRIPDRDGTAWSRVRIQRLLDSLATHRVRARQQLPALGRQPR